MKIIANYLPQFHVTAENSAWWGEGYTDWTAVRKAKPLFPGHQQPVVPLGGEYIMLDDPDSIRRQIDLAHRYGIDAFGIYHYWMNSKQNLLSKPAELILENSDMDIGFMFIWDNSTWKRSWTAVRPGKDGSAESDSIELEGQQGDPVLAQLDYGGLSDWESHFQYLLPFFRDGRYLRLNGKPMFAILKPAEDFPALRAMSEYWDKRAVEEGLGGLVCLSLDTYANRRKGAVLDYKFRYSPFCPLSFADWLTQRKDTLLARKSSKPMFRAYDAEWEAILRGARSSDERTLLSGFVGFDDTPRRGSRARIIKGATPENFSRYFTQLLEICIGQGKEYVFLSAWNEWGEGMHLEPDEQYGFAWLDAVAESLKAAGI